MIRRPPRSTQSRSSAASDVYKRQEPYLCPDVMLVPITINQRLYFAGFDLVSVIYRMRPPAERKIAQNNLAGALLLAVSFHEPGRAELLLRPDIWAARQHRPTHQRFMVSMGVSENVETPQQIKCI